MSERDEVFKKFGPFLIEAIALTSLESINELRQSLRLPLYTKQQTITKILNTLSTLKPYDWTEKDVK